LNRYLKNIVIFLIQLIEKYELKNHNTDESTPLTKMMDIIPLSDNSVETDYGYTPVSEINRTIPLQRWELLLENGNSMECADDHIVYCDGHIVKFVKDLSIDDYVITKSGISKVKFVRKLYGKICMFDFTVDGPEPSYYTNDILSHNTVSAAIVILHFVLFNDDKGAMVVANKGGTVKEIVRKIKDIYRLLPFYLKKGVVNWNEKSIAFENNSRIQTENRTKEPAIGFTIDLLYLDEFAHIPDNYVRDYYGAIVPVVSSIENSKIIITSTPDGFNMFHDLLIGAEKEIDDPLKNPYTAMRVYWYQVAGRQDTQMQLMPNKLKKYKFTKSGVLRELRSKGLKFYKKTKGGDVIDCVRYDSDDTVTHITNIRKMRIFGIPLPELAIVTNWEEDETKLIGGKDKFKQEYDLHFITGDKLLFDRIMMDSLKKKTIPFNYIPIKHFDDKLTIPYDTLKWITDKPELFDINQIKNYYILPSVDLSEGLAQDYTVFNLFRLMIKDKSELERDRGMFETIYDLFKLEQIGMYRNNIYSIKEAAHIFYLICFEFFDPEKLKSVLEYNTYGGEFLSHLPHVFDGNNEFFNAIFLRYKHRKDDIKPKIGLKLSRDKHLIVDKEFQQAVKKRKMMIHNDVNIGEVSTFSKHVTPGGSVTYRAESGHDDCLLPDTQIKTRKGYKKIKDIIIGDEVLTHLNNYKKVTNISIKDFDGDMYEVKFKGQVPLDITYNHPLYSITYGSNKKRFDKREWNTPNKLVKNKHKCVNIIDEYDKNINKIINYTELYEKYKNSAIKNMKLLNITLDSSFSKFLGLFLADGNCYKSSKTSYRVSVSFNKKSVILIDEIKQYLENLNLSVFEENHKNHTMLITYNKTLYELLIKCYDKETKEKILPYYAIDFGKDLKYVLEYWIKGDGWSVNRKNRTPHVIGCSTSLQLALSMRDIASALGKTNTITKNKRYRYGVRTKDQYWVTIYDEHPKSSSLKKITEFEISSNLDYSKKYNYKGLTYNLEVEDDNSYIANGIVVHNCVMTNVLLSTVYDNIGFKNLVDMYIENELGGDVLHFVEKFAEETSSSYKNGGFSSARQKIYGNTNPSGRHLSPFVNNVPYSRNSPFN